MSTRYNVANKPRFYVRMCKDGVWYFLLRVTWDKADHRMKPLWWPESMMGVSKPYLYKTLVGARDAQDNYVSHGASSEVVKWPQSN